jgi:hypothetical protein
MGRLLVALAVVALTPRTAQASSNKCIEVSDTVGETRCTSYGALWSTERAIPLFVSVGGWSSIINPAGSQFGGTLHDRVGTTIGRFDAADVVRGPLRAYGIDFRMGGYFAKYGYVGLDWAFGIGRAEGDGHDLAGNRLTPAAGVNFFQARVGPAFGVRVPLGRISLRLEGLTALQILLLATKRSGPDGVTVKGGNGGVMLAIEPRVAVDWWFTPDSTLTAWAGTNVLRTGDYSMGLTAAFHLRAFDGAF